MTRRLDVYLGEKKIGLISEGDRRIAEFLFLPAYLDDDERPVLSQSFEDDLLKVYRERAHSIPRFFLNLLPEPESRMHRHQKQLYRVVSGDDLGLLSALGEDLPGAVILRPDPESGRFEDLTRSPHDEEDEGDEEDSRARASLRFSLAGVQLKFSVIADGEKISLPLRSGEGNFILKVAGREFDGLAANESAMMAWARLAGFDVAPAKVIPTPLLRMAERLLAGTQDESLLVARFDRSPKGRVHQEDLAQVVGRLPHRKYVGSYAWFAPVVRGILGIEGAEEYLRRLTLMVAQGNSDAHLKNWSLLYQNPEVPGWSPLYDQVSTIAWPRIQKWPALKLGNAKHFHAVDLSALATVGIAADLPRARAEEIVMATLERLRQGWPEMLHEEALPSSHRQALIKHWKRVRILRDAGSLGSEAD